MKIVIFHSFVYVYQRVATIFCVHHCSSVFRYVDASL